MSAQAQHLSLRDHLYPLLMEHLLGSDLQQQAAQLRSLQPYVIQLRRSFRELQLKVDYSNALVRQAYMLAYYPLQITQLISVLYEFVLSDIEAKFQKPELHVALVGGGPAPEALAFLSYLQKVGLTPERVHFYVLDAYDWQREQETTQQLANQLFPATKSRLQWIALDINKEITCVPDCISKADLVSLQYMLSDVEYDARRIYLKNVDKLLARMWRGVPLVITDSLRIVKTSTFRQLRQNLQVNRHGIALAREYMEDYVERFVKYPGIIFHHLLTGADGLIPRWYNKYAALVALANNAEEERQHHASRSLKIAQQRQKFLRMLAKHLHEREQFSAALAVFISDDNVPDLILLDEKNAAVICAEAREWTDVRLADDGRLLARDDHSQDFYPCENPLLIAQENLEKLQSVYASYLPTFDAHQNLKHLPMAWQAALFLPNVPQQAINKLVSKGFWPAGAVVGKEAYNSLGAIGAQLRSLYPPEARTLPTLDHLQIVRGLIDSQLVIKRLDQAVGVFTNDQAKLIQEPIPALEKRYSFFDRTSEAPVPSTSMLTSQTIRLVSGPAGSGKTLVIIERAKWIRRHYPSARILVLCYNAKLRSLILDPELGQICHVKTFHKQVFDIEGKKYRSNIDNVSKWLIKWFPQELRSMGLSAEFIAREFEWRWELSLDDEKYLAFNRRGRGKALSKSEREAINKLHANYQAMKQRERAYDWESAHMPALKIIKAGQVNYEPYDAILVDEGQDFAPSWFSLVRRILKPDGYLMVAYDPNQSVFRNYSWKERGIQAKGLVRKLSVPFRSTRRINMAAHSLFHKSSTNLAEVADPLDPDTSSDIELEKYSLPDGVLPEIYLCPTQEKAKAAHASLLQQLQMYGNWSEDELPRRIGVITWKSIPDHLRLPKFQKCYHTYRQVKGVEFDAVILLNPEALFTDLEDQEAVQDSLRWIHVGMTRARSNLAIVVTGSLPAPLEPLLSTCAVSSVAEDYI